jgi:hypothetical protein
MPLIYKYFRSQEDAVECGSENGGALLLAANAHEPTAAGLPSLSSVLAPYAG